MEEEKMKIKKFLNSEFCEKWMKQKMLRVPKSTAASEDLRKYANGVFKTETHSGLIHEKTWRCYTSCIISADNNSEALAFSYGNRSAILIHMSKYEECINDIDRALAISKDNVFRLKLMLRKVKCLHALNSDTSQITLKEVECLIGKINNEAMKMALTNTLNQIKVFLQRPIKLDAPKKNKKFQSLNSLIETNEINDFFSIEIQFNEKYGRHLVAAKDFKPGDVIFIEKPYIQCINLSNMHGFCAHCFNVCWANIPCETCSWAMFCSEKCKREAWKQYHDIECSVWACAKQRGDCTPHQLALRIMILALKEFGSLENIKAEVKNIDECTDIEKGFINDGKIKPSNLKAIFSLSQDISQESYSKVHKEPVIKMLKSIGLNTKLFGNKFNYSNTDSYKANENAILFGTLFLRLSKIGQINGRQMWNYRYYPCRVNPPGLACPVDKQCCPPGCYIAPVTSLLNHSCWPNASVCYSSNNCVIVYATRSIKKGEQLFDCYTLEDSTDKRQKILSDVYNFVCDCPVCKGNSFFGANLDIVYFNKNSSTEEMLTEKYKDIIKSGYPKMRTDYDRNMIKYLGTVVEEALQVKQPSGIGFCLMFCLQKAYEQIYGISLDVPEICNNI